MSITFDTRERDRRAAQFEALAATAPALVVAATKATVLGIEADAKALAAVDTGYMRGSISSEFRGSGASFYGVVGPSASYARYVEEGTSRMAAQPFMRPATDRRIPGYVAALEAIAGRQP